MNYVFGGQANSDVNMIIGQFVALNTWGDLESLFPVFTTLGVVKDEKLIGGVVYHDYSPEHGTIEYSGAAIDPSWLKGETIYHMFSYMFDELNCQMVVTKNSALNKRLHRQLKRLGHTSHYIKRLHGKDEDAIIWTLTREKWMENPFFIRSRKRFMEKNNVTA